MEKKDIRNHIFLLRKKKNQEELIEKSHRICQEIISTEAYKKASCIYAYMDCKGEVSMAELLNHAWAAGKSVAVPKVLGKEIKFFYISSYEDTAPGYYDIPEPITGREAREETALMIMPGVAFDRNRHRCGYGGGYYDRYLSVHKEHPTIAAAFDFQIIEHVPTDVFDILPQMLITETAVW